MNAEQPVLPPTEWDRDMAALLAPFAKREEPPVLRYHLFANTFPLAYHYFWALRKAGRKDPARFLRYGSGFVTPKRMEWGYATRTGAGTRVVCSVPVTRFKPCSAFVERNLWTSALWRDLKSAIPEPDRSPALESFLRCVPDLSPRVDWVIVYSEIPELGAFVSRLVEKSVAGSKACKVGVFSLASRGATHGAGVRRTKTDKNVAPASRWSHVAPPVPMEILESRSPLRLFVYGGPLSTYFGRKTTRYLELELDGDAAEEAQELETVFVVDEEAYSSQRQSIVLYHEMLRSNDGENGKCKPFSSVYRAFNEVAWLLQSRASFLTADEFRKCIVKHHGSPSESAVVLPEQQP